jgi:formylglycine-generating enzyme required for sulfatase activity
VYPYVLTAEQIRGLPPKQSFKDCAKECPEMVVVPAGELEMGSPDNDKQGDEDERPQHTVKIATPFAVSKFEITFAEWDACVFFKTCRETRDDGWGRETRPALYVSWNDAKQYVDWLSKLTRKPYRLLSEAEWEYATRANSQTTYSFGDTSERLAEHAWYNENSDRKAHPVGEKAENGFGLRDMHGNVWEWVEDCYREGYKGSPTNGAADVSGDCNRRVVRGGAWFESPEELRSANRNWSTPDFAGNGTGFRVARTLGE